nr:DUF3298 domain-containing protein [uncultured Pseudodesulfovibrio sp.]
MHLLPKQRQWQNWSLPNKYTTIGTLLSLLAIIIPCSSYVLNRSYDYIYSKYWIETESLSNQIFHKFTGKDITDDDLKIEVTYPIIRSLIGRPIFDQTNEELLASIAGNLNNDIIAFNASFDISMHNDRILSILFDRYTYYHLAMNGDGSYGSINIDIRSNRYIEFYDVFDIKKNPLSKIKEILFYKLKDCLLDEYYLNQDYIPRFAFSNTGVIFIFSEYEVTVGACGHLKVEIPYDEIGVFLRKDGPLGDKFKPTAKWDGREFKKSAIGIYY